VNKAIDVSNLWFGYDAESVLHDVTFQVEQGQFLGIIGPNGGGKSTLLKLLLGLLQPQQGSISIRGKSPPVPEVAYVPQTLSFDRQFPITALEVVLGAQSRHLSFLGRYRSEDVDCARYALEQAGVLEYESHLFGTLSGGISQRVLIARALVSNPSILLLDEPTSCTDQEAESQLFEIIETLKGSTTIVMVTHHIEVIAPLVEKVLCIHKTALVMDPKEMCEHLSFGLYHIPEMKERR